MALEGSGGRGYPLPLIHPNAAPTLTPTRTSRFRTALRTLALLSLAWIVTAAVASKVVPEVMPGDLDDRASDPGGQRLVGAVHMHTRASDGSGTVDDLVDAARANGLDFIVVTDHNTAQPTRTEYRSGVLVIVAEELSTPTGHVLLLGVDTVSLGPPDPATGGLPARSLDDATLRLVAHPTGRRFWRDRSMATVDGLELWNADSEWRNDGLLDWLEALSLLPFRPRLAMIALVDRPSSNLALLDSVAALREVSTTCAVDAHARIPVTRNLLIPFPSYRMTLGLLNQHLRLDAPLSGDAEADAARLVRALSSPGGYCAVGGLGDAGAVSVTIEKGTLQVEVPPGSGETRIRLYQGGSEVRQVTGDELTHAVDGRSTYRVEIDRRVRLLRRRWLPWIISGPLSVVTRDPADTKPFGSDLTPESGGR